jgi:hypothetical protein
MSSPTGEAFPNVATRSTYASLRVLEEEDMPWLRSAQLEVLGAGWRSRGMTGSSGAFESNVWAGSAVQLLGVDSTGRTISWLNAYNYEPMDQVVSVAVARLSERTLGRAFLASTVLFLDYVFRVLSVRKIYFDVAEYNLPMLESLVGDPLQPEALLADRLVADARTWNLHILSVTRDQLHRFSLYDALMKP